MTVPKLFPPSLVAFFDAGLLQVKDGAMHGKDDVGDFAVGVLVGVAGVGEELFICVGDDALFGSAWRFLRLWVCSVRARGILLTAAFCSVAGFIARLTAALALFVRLFLWNRF